MFTAFKVQIFSLHSVKTECIFIPLPLEFMQAAEPPTNSNHLCDGENRKFASLNFIGAKKSAASSLYREVCCMAAVQAPWLQCSPLIQNATHCSNVMFHNLI
jgi:hypothetical protein